MISEPILVAIHCSNNPPPEECNAGEATVARSRTSNGSIAGDTISKPTATAETAQPAARVARTDAVTSVANTDDRVTGWCVSGEASA